MADLDAMSVAELKSFVENQGGDISGCFEKNDLLARARLCLEEAAPAKKDPLYCAACKKRFQSKATMKEHKNSKKHKEQSAAVRRGDVPVKKQAQAPSNTTVVFEPEPVEDVLIAEEDLPVSGSEDKVSGSEEADRSSESDTASEEQEVQTEEVVTPEELDPMAEKRAAVAAAVAAARQAQAVEKITEMLAADSSSMSREVTVKDLAAFDQLELKKKQEMAAAQSGGPVIRDWKHQANFGATKFIKP
eukprot:TRINITY_DN1756_c0_g1_i1.p1 TRINITY_DN1756_c0_g1~~TRINITY_DN1756_c0_g1_i1.p1  ORF type:complete len:247 (+),score=79.26 TRINITY_DN1756_c0_g1_i1:146-886(+)